MWVVCGRKVIVLWRKSPFDSFSYHFKINGHFLAISHGGMLFDAPDEAASANFSISGRRYLKNLFPMLSFPELSTTQHRSVIYYNWYIGIYLDCYSVASWNDSWTLEGCEHILATLATQVTSLNILNGQNSTVNLCLVGDWSKQNLQDQSHLLHGCCLKIPDMAHGYQQICQPFS